MTMKTRRLVAVTLTSALFAGPVLVCGAPAQASTAAPASLLDGVTGTLTGLLGGASSTDPISALLGEVITTLGSATGGTGGTGTTDPVTALTDTFTSVLTGSGDPQTMITDLATQLTSQLSGVEGGQELIAAITSGDPQEVLGTIVSVLPIDSLFPGGLSDGLMSLLGQTSNPDPDNTDELIAAMTEYYKKQNMTDDEVKSDAAAKGVPSSVIQALMLALSKKSPAPKPPATGPSAACTSATKKVTMLKKQVRIAKHKHQKAKAKRLAKKLLKARIAKIRAC